MRTGIWLFMLVLIIVLPLLVVWAINHLFGLSIGYSLESWFAVIVLMAATGNLKLKFR